MPRTLAELLAHARAGITRLTPGQAFEAASNGALLVDTRSEGDRERSGVAPGSIHIPLSVLLWRLAPDSAWRNPHVGATDRKLVVICEHGFSSSLAAASLVELGLDASDVIGGFDAWLEEELPTVPPGARGGELPGMGQPEAPLGDASRPER